MSRQLRSISWVGIAVLLALFAFLPVAGAAPLAATQNVSLKDNLYDPKTITVNVGDTITWKNNGKNEHTVWADDSSFKSGDLDAGDTFSFTFTKPGAFAYYCKYHGGPGGKGMSGVVVVQQVSASGNAPTSMPQTGGSDNSATLFALLGLALIGIGFGLRSWKQGHSL